MSKAEEAAPSAPPNYEASQQQSYPQKQEPGYPPQQHGYPPQQQPGYPPQQQPGYPPQQHGYPPQQHGYPMQQYSGGAPPGGYAPVPTTTVIGVQPAVTGPVPDDHCTFSILNTIFCCFWIGIYAIIKSQAVRDAINRGDIQGAQRMSREALQANKIALGIGIFFNLVYIGLVVFYCIYVVNAVKPLYDFN